MKLPSINPQSLVRNIITHMSIALWVFLAIMLLAEGFVLKNSVGKFLSGNNTETSANAQIVRINFNQYEKIEQRLVSGEQFKPANTSANNPFGLASAK